jgi:hypothetical protein
MYSSRPHPDSKLGKIVKKHAKRIANLYKLKRLVEALKAVPPAYEMSRQDYIKFQQLKARLLELELELISG